MSCRLFPSWLVVQNISPHPPLGFARNTTPQAYLKTPSLKKLIFCRHMAHATPKKLKKLCFLRGKQGSFVSEQRIQFAPAARREPCFPALTTSSRYSCGRVAWKPCFLGPGAPVRCHVFVCSRKRRISSGLEHGRGHHRRPHMSNPIGLTSQFEPV